MNREPVNPILDPILDPILGSEDELVPSSGFLAAVMERVEEEALAPPPIPFPWAKAVPGMVLTAGVLGWTGYLTVRFLAASAASWTAAAPALPAAALGPLKAAVWVAGALAASWLSWAFSKRLAGRSGLL